MSEGSASVVIWVTHLLGTGHLFRMAAVARALGARGVSTTVVSGGFPVPGIDCGDAELIQLLPVRSPNAKYTILEDESGEEATDALFDRRLEQLRDILETRRPDVFVTELFPFGRRKFRRELLPVLESLRVNRPEVPLLCSVRDILEPPSKPEKASEAMDRIAKYYDWILVHGDPEITRLEDSYPLPDNIRANVRYSGFIGGAHSVGVSDRNNEIIVSAGGGAVGQGLYDAAIGAAKLCVGRDLVWRVLVGRNVTDDAFDAYAAGASANVIVERTRPDFSDLLRSARLSVSQAGYNTVCDILAAGCASVLVPFAADGEREQTLRAMSLAKQGRAQVLTEIDLSPASLAGCVNAALECGPEAFRSEVDDRSCPGCRSHCRTFQRGSSVTGNLDWKCLRHALDKFADDGRCVQFWWRDDDAVAATDQLDRLIEVANGFGVPFLLAVIPRSVEVTLVERVSDEASVRVGVHGYAHINHAAGRRKETGTGRSSSVE